VCLSRTRSWGPGACVFCVFMLSACLSACVCVSACCSCDLRFVLVIDRLCIHLSEGSACPGVPRAPAQPSRLRLHNPLRRHRLYCCCCRRRPHPWCQGIRASTRYRPCPCQQGRRPRGGPAMPGAFPESAAWPGAGGCSQRRRPRPLCPGRRPAGAAQRVQWPGGARRPGGGRLLGTPGACPVIDPVLRCPQCPPAAKYQMCVVVSQ
jgi:hypothetical protein